MVILLVCLRLVLGLADASRNGQSWRPAQFQTSTITLTSPRPLGDLADLARDGRGAF
jgi:hypothetical protein